MENSNEKIKKKHLGRICSVPQCSQKRGEGVHLHHFPHGNQVLLKKWVHILKIGKTVGRGMTVCSRHFEREDYILPDYSTKKPSLKRGAVPSQNLPKSHVVDANIDPEKSASTASASSGVNTRKRDHGKKSSEAPLKTEPTDHVKDMPNTPADSEHDSVIRRTRGGFVQNNTGVMELRSRKIAGRYAKIDLVDDENDAKKNRRSAIERRRSVSPGMLEPGKGVFRKSIRRERIEENSKCSEIKEEKRILPVDERRYGIVRYIGGVKLYSCRSCYALFLKDWQLEQHFFGNGPSWSKDTHRHKFFQANERKEHGTKEDQEYGKEQGRGIKEDQEYEEQRLSTGQIRDHEYVYGSLGSSFPASTTKQRAPSSSSSTVFADTYVGGEEAADTAEEFRTPHEDHAYAYFTQPKLSKQGSCTPNLKHIHKTNSQRRVDEYVFGSLGSSLPAGSTRQREPSSSSSTVSADPCDGEDFADTVEEFPTLHEDHAYFSRQIPPRSMPERSKQDSKKAAKKKRPKRGRWKARKSPRRLVDHHHQEKTKETNESRVEECPTIKSEPADDTQRYPGAQSCSPETVYPVKCEFPLLEVKMEIDDTDENNTLLREMGNWPIKEEIFDEGGNELNH